MSASDSRKAFLTKLSVCLAAVAAVPGVLWRRGPMAVDAMAEPQEQGGPAGFPVKPDLRAIARSDADL